MEMLRILIVVYCTGVNIVKTHVTLHLKIYAFYCKSDFIKVGFKNRFLFDYQFLSYV